MGKTSTTLSSGQKINSKFYTKNSLQIRFLQDYCRAFCCIKTKGTGTVTVWVN